MVVDLDVSSVIWDEEEGSVVKQRERTSVVYCTFGVGQILPL